MLDASALLAFAQGEAGEDHVEAALVSGATCGAANWSEVAQKVITAGRDWTLVRSLLLSYELEIEPVQIADAERAAEQWERDSGLSLGDRLCLALGERLDAPVLTADSAWGSSDRIRQIR